MFSLRRLRPRLQDGLAAIPETLTLADAVAAGKHIELLTTLLQPMTEIAHWGVRLTTVMKILHRKRPLFIPL